jgi:hypothetical protein
VDSGLPGGVATFIEPPAAIISGPETGPTATGSGETAPGLETGGVAVAEGLVVAMAFSSDAEGSAAPPHAGAKSAARVTLAN